MPQRTLGFLVSLGLLAACDPGMTGVELAIHADPSLGIDRYQISLGDRIILADVAPLVEVETSEEMAGEAWTVEVWGLAGPRQLAYGSAIVTPLTDQLPTYQLLLTEVSCGSTCALGAVRCMDDGTTTCVTTADGCRTWGPVLACTANAPFCSSGECATTCVDECAPGETTCDGALADRTCGNFDGDSCREWSTPIACGADETCSADACTVEGCAVDGCEVVPPPVCIGPSQLRVVDGSGTCEANGTCSFVFDDQACGAFGCTNGECNCNCSQAYQCCLDVSPSNEDNLCDLLPIRCNSGDGVPVDELTDYVRMNCPTWTCGI